MCERKKTARLCAQDKCLILLALYFYWCLLSRTNIPLFRLAYSPPLLIPWGRRAELSAMRFGPLLGSQTRVEEENFSANLPSCLAGKWRWSCHLWGQPRLAGHPPWPAHAPDAWGTAWVMGLKPRTIAPKGSYVSSAAETQASDLLTLELIVLMCWIMGITPYSSWSLAGMITQQELQVPVQIWASSQQPCRAGSCSKGWL